MKMHILPSLLAADFGRLGEEILRAEGVRAQDMKHRIDAVAAEVILQDYLNAQET